MNRHLRCFEWSFPSQLDRIQLPPCTPDSLVALFERRLEYSTRMISVCLVVRGVWINQCALTRITRSTHSENGWKGVSFDCRVVFPFLLLESVIWFYFILIWFWNEMRWELKMVECFVELDENEQNNNFKTRFLLLYLMEWDGKRKEEMRVIWLVFIPIFQPISNVVCKIISI